MTITLVIIGIIVCILVLAWISTKEKWDNITKPPNLKANFLIHLVIISTDNLALNLIRRTKNFLKMWVR